MPYIRLSTNVAKMEIFGKSTADGLLGEAHLESVDPDYAGVEPPEPTHRGVPRRNSLEKPLKSN